LPGRDLRQDVGGSTETVEPERAPLARHAVAAPADQPGAQERRRLDVVGWSRQRKAEPRVGDSVRGVAAVARVTREQRRIAEIFPAAAAIGARLTGVPEPGHAHALAQRKTFDVSAERRHAPDDLVAWHDRQFRIRQLAVDHMQVGPADAAGRDLQQDLACARRRNWPLAQHQRRARAFQHHGPHACHGHLARAR
jgi:hypothetical protein